MPLDEEKKFLGVFDSPSGGNVEQIEKINEKVETWTNRMRNGHLPSYLGWKSYHLKLWPSIRWGLGVMTNDVEEMEDLFNKHDYNMMNLFGVASTITAGFQKLHSTLTICHF